MRKFAVATALLALSAGAKADGQRDVSTICSNMLQIHPSDWLKIEAPGMLPIYCGERPNDKPLVVALRNEDSVTWWMTHTVDGKPLPGESK